MSKIIGQSKAGLIPILVEPIRYHGLYAIVLGVSDNNRYKALLNTARMLTLGQLSYRDMVCEGLSQPIPLGNSAVFALL